MPNLVTTQILFFGKIVELTETSKLDFLVPKNKLTKFMQELFLKYPLLEKENFSIAVNKKIISDEYIFNENDEIALMPPFSGG